MGLDAMVRCRCWEDGLVSDPPIPRDQIVADEENELWPDPSLRDDRASFGRFLAWRETACAHRGFHQVFEKVGNAASLGGFLDALDRAGADNFPNLCAEIGGNPTPPDRSALALEELELFTVAADLGEATALIDDEAGIALRWYQSGTDGTFHGVNPWRIGFDEDGFFIRRLGDPPTPNQGRDRWRGSLTQPSRAAATSDRTEEVFRSKLFTQEVIPLENDASIEAWILSDERRNLVGIRLVALDGSDEVVVALREPIEAPLEIGPGGKVWCAGESYPRRFRVEAIPVPRERFSDVVDTLTTLFRASVETGHPVVWF